jgi:hypothetical protein
MQHQNKIHDNLAQPNRTDSLCLKAPSLLGAGMMKGLGPATARIPGITRRLSPTLFEVLQRPCMCTSQLGLAFG